MQSTHVNNECKQHMQSTHVNNQCIGNIRYNIRNQHTLQHHVNIDKLRLSVLFTECKHWMQTINVINPRKIRVYNIIVKIFLRATHFPKPLFSRNWTGWTLSASCPLILSSFCPLYMYWLHVLIACADYMCCVHSVFTLIVYMCCLHSVFTCVDCMCW